MKTFNNTDWVTGSGPLPPAESRPIHAGVGGQGLIGRDDRRAVQVNQDPWSRICYLRITDAQRRMQQGTGWFASPDTIITAGHCVYESGWARKVEVIPNHNGDTNRRPIAVVESKAFAALPEWIANGNRGQDVGVIKLPGPIDTGVLRYAVEEDPTDRRVNISGYPIDKGGRQMVHANRIYDQIGDLLFYEVDTTGGQSGSPVMMGSLADPVVIGIHAYGTGTFNQNSGPRITAKVDRWIRQQVNCFEPKNR